MLGVHDTESASVVGTNSAAVAATFAHEAFMTPVEVVKQRLQIHNTPYKGAIDCIAATFKKEGFFAFYRSFSTQVCHARAAACGPSPRLCACAHVRLWRRRPLCCATAWRFCTTLLPARVRCARLRTLAHACARCGGRHCTGPCV